MSGDGSAQVPGLGRLDGDGSTPECSAGRCRPGWRCGYHEHVHEVALRLTIEEADRADRLHR